MCDDGDADSFIHHGDICGLTGAPGWPDCDDNCYVPQNADQLNTDHDYFGNLCEQPECVETPDYWQDENYYQRDSDGDGVNDCWDTCPDVIEVSNLDTDGDGHGDDCDNCRTVPNGTKEADTFAGNQADYDGDGIGNACDQTPELPGSPGNDDSDGDDMPAALEALAGTSDSNIDTDGDGQTDWIEWTLHRTDPANPDTDGDGVWDPIEIDRGSDPLDPLSFFGLCGDTNRDGDLNVVDLVLVRRTINGNSVPSSFAPDRCDYVVSGACTATDISELRAYLVDPIRSPLADICPGVPHDVAVVVFNMDGEAALWNDAPPASTVGDDFVVAYEGAGSLFAEANSATADASIDASLSPNPQDWTGYRLRFAMLVPTAAQIGASDGIRITLSSSSFSAGSSNRVWFLGTSVVPQGIWKEYEIDPTVGWDQATGAFNIAQVRRIRIQWNLDEAGATGRLFGESLYLDDFKRVLPASLP